MKAKNITIIIIIIVILILILAGFLLFKYLPQDIPQTIINIPPSGSSASGGGFS